MLREVVGVDNGSAEGSREVREGKLFIFGEMSFLEAEDVRVLDGVVNEGTNKVEARGARGVI